MKKLVVLLTLITSASAFSQGKVNFQNYLTTAGINAPISYRAGGPATAGLINGSAVGVTVVNGLDWSGVYARAGLYGGPAGTAEDALVLITPSVPFRGSVATEAGRVLVTSAWGGSTRTVDGVPAGSPGVFQVRAWDGGMTNIVTEAEALALPEYYSGRSGLINIASLGGLGSPPSSPSPLVGLTSFDIVYVPEPSIIGLGILGAIGGLFLFRRRN
jgi:hypothetical protein